MTKEELEKQFEKDKKLYEENKRHRRHDDNDNPYISIVITKDGIKYE